MTETTRKDLIVRTLLTSTFFALALTLGPMTGSAEHDQPESNAARQSNDVYTSNGAPVGAPVFEEAERNGGGGN
jgi:hypothetical protein